MNRPLISVIIPVYNVEKYLEKCVNSVLEQSYKELEIWLINDGSTDKSGVLCDLLGEKDSRIRVIHKENGGLSEARNVALDKMTGKYVTFVDSDDYITKDYIEFLYNLINEKNACISLCGFKKIYSYDQELDMLEKRVEVLEKKEAIKEYLYQRKFTASAYCKLYKADLFSEIRYPLGFYYEDMAIICNLLDLAKRIVICNEQKYYYVQRNNSIMREQFNLKKMHRVEIAENIKNFICNNYPELIKAANARCFLATIQTFREIPFEQNYSREIDYLWSMIVTYRRGVIQDKNAKIVLKIIAICTLFGKRGMKILGKMYTKMFL